MLQNLTKPPKHAHDHGAHVGSGDFACAHTDKVNAMHPRLFRALPQNEHAEPSTTREQETRHAYKFVVCMLNMVYMMGVSIQH